jgi:hypothetical protein
MVRAQDGEELLHQSMVELLTRRVYYHPDFATALSVYSLRCVFTEPHRLHLHYSIEQRACFLKNTRVRFLVMQCTYGEEGVLILFYWKTPIHKKNVSQSYGTSQS